MHNLYFVETDNFELLREKVNHIIYDNKLTLDNLIVYDMEETNVSLAINDLDTYSLFGESKIILCKNANFLTTTKPLINHDLSLLEKYLENPNRNNILILASSKVDGKKNIVKLVKKNCQVITEEININDYLDKKLIEYISSNFS